MDKESREKAGEPKPELPKDNVSTEETERATRDLYRAEDEAHRGEDDDVP